MISFFTDDKVEMPKIRKAILKDWIKKVIELKGKKLANINYQFCSDETILEANIKYLNHNYYTDIITFDYCIEDKISGDMLISLETVASNAEKFGTDYATELHRVIIHGVLHMLGIGDKSEEDAKIMREEEDKALSLLNELNSKNKTLLK